MEAQAADGGQITDGLDGLPDQAWLGHEGVATTEDDFMNGGVGIEQVNQRSDIVAEMGKLAGGEIAPKTKAAVNGTFVP